MALALTGNAFLYFDVDETWLPLVGFACFAVAVFILAQPNDGEDELHAKNRMWSLVFFAVQAIGAAYITYKSYRNTLDVQHQLVVSMLTRFFIMIVCVTKTFDVAESELTK